MELYSFRHQTYVEAAFTGLCRGLLRLPIEHPFDCIKTQWQANPQLKSALRTVNHINSTHGIKGFWNGAAPAAFRNGIKELYRWPLMLCLPHIYNKLLIAGNLSQTKHARDSTTAKTLTGLTIAGVESFIICPLERVKVTFITREKASRSVALQSVFKISPNGHAAKQVSTKFIFNNYALRGAFKGMSALFLRQTVAWVSFLVPDTELKKLARLRQREKKYHQSGTQPDQCERLSGSTLMLIAAVVGLINTTLVMPIDCVKTNLQKFNSAHALQDVLGSRKASGDKFNYTARDTCRYIIKTFGYRAFFAGFSVRFIQYLLNSVISVPLIELLETRSIQARVLYDNK